MHPIIYPYRVEFREGASSLAKHPEVLQFVVSHVVMATSMLLVTTGTISLSLCLSRQLSVMLLAGYIKR